MGTKQTS